MKKHIVYVILLVVSLVLLLSGCVQLDIDTGIDADFTAYLSYHIMLDVGESDMHRSELLFALNKIGWHYQQNLGFTVEINIETAPYFLIMTRRVENDSFEQAFESLKEMLTDESMTPFMQVDMASQSFFRQERYILSATADIPQIMRLSNVEELSPDLQQQLEDAMEAGKGTITLTLPASEVVSFSHQASIQGNQMVMVVPLEFSDKTELELAAKLNLLSDGAPGGSLDEIIGHYSMLRKISIIACCVALFVLLVLLPIIIISTRRKRST